MSYERTEAHREAQRQRIQEWKPWLKSTGPKTEEGKVRSSRNRFTGGERPTLRRLARLLRS